MDLWTTPPGATPQQYTGPAKRDAAVLSKTLGEMSARMRDGFNHLLQSAGILVEKGILRVTGSLIIEGDLEVVGGIKNEQLANPVLFDQTGAPESGFAVPLSSAPAEIASCTYTMPTGYSRMQFTMMGTCRVKNDTATTQYVYLGARRRMLSSGGVVYGEQSQQIALPAGFSGTLSSPYIYSDDLPAGDSIEFFLNVSASAELSADPVWNQARTAVALALTR